MTSAPYRRPEQIPPNALVPPVQGGAPAPSAGCAEGGLEVKAAASEASGPRSRNERPSRPSSWQRRRAAKQSMARSWNLATNVST